MSNILDELEKRFRAVEKVKAPETTEDAIRKYLAFVSETTPLNTIAREKNLYANSPIEQSYTIPEPIMRVRFRMFHNALISAAENAGLSRRHQIAVIVDAEENCIHLRDNPTRVYQVISRGKYKKDEPQRIKMLLAFWKHEGGFSAKKIATLLNVSDISAIRRAVREINSRFRELVSNTADIVLVNKKRKAYIYSLNRDAFEVHFVLKRRRRK